MTRVYLHNRELFRDNISRNNACTYIIWYLQYYKRSRLHVQILTQAADFYFDGGG